MIENKYDDLLDSKADALINTVNCVGVMGKGIALQFKKAWPENFKAYELACKIGEVQTGKMFIFKSSNQNNPKFIINFPTKNHWKEDSKLSYIELGLQDLINEIKKLGISSIAIPPLGCGNGGLHWKDVRSLIVRSFEEVPNVQVFLYPPSEKSLIKQKIPFIKELKMTASRAVLLALMHRYSRGGYGLGKIEIQKLAYFLQCAGEPLNLRYEKLHFGPYADNLNHALSNMEGSFIQGFGDRKQQSEIQPLPQALEAAHNFLRSHHESHERLNRVSNLIDGFEDSFGLELLATVHWVLKQEPSLSHSVEKTTEAVHNWNERKKRLIKPWQVETAMKRLKDQGWI